MNLFRGSQTSRLVILAIYPLFVDWFGRSFTVLSPKFDEEAISVKNVQIDPQTNGYMVEKAKRDVVS